MESQDSLRDALAAIERELAAVESRAADLRDAAKVLRKIGAVSSNGSVSASADSALPGEAAPGAEIEYPKTTDVAASVLRSREAHAHTTRQVLNEAQRRKLLNPDLKKPYGTILEALKRLVEKDHRLGFLRLEPSVGETRWVYLPPDAGDTYYMYTGDPKDPTGDARQMYR